MIGRYFEHDRKAAFLLQSTYVLPLRHRLHLCLCSNNTHFSHQHTMHSSTLYTLNIFLTWTSISLSQTCYGPDKQTVFTGDIPCTNATASACCSADGYCLENGLCITNLVLGRGSCTDQSWTSEACPQYCTDCLQSPRTLSSRARS